MNVSQLTMRDLEYLITLGDELHFGKAAAKLHVSQPTLSEQIKKMESLLGVALFERSNRQVTLSPYGVELILLARDILNKAQDFVDYAKKLQVPLTGEFKLGAISTVGPYYFPHVLELLKRAFPQLILILHEGHTDQLLKMLDEGKLDAVIASQTFPEDRYRFYALYFESFLLAAPKNQSFATKNGKISIHHLDLSKLIFLAEGNCLTDETLNLCSLSFKHRSNRLQATSLETLKHLVATGVGISLIPKLATQMDQRMANLINYYPLSEKNAGRNIVLVTREKYTRPDQIRLLVKELKRAKIEN